MRICLLALCLLFAACSGPQLTAEERGLGKELPPAEGAETGANVARKGGDPAPKESPTAPAKPSLPADSAIKTDAPADVARPPDDATRLPSGLSYKIQRPGADGPEATGDSTVSVHYAGWTTDGNLFDSSVLRRQPLTIGLNQVIEGWRVGVAGMKIGEIRRIWIPESLAYKGQANRPAGMLVFDVELLRVE